MKAHIIAATLTLGLLSVSCNSRPKMVEAQPSSTSMAASSSAPMHSMNESSSMTGESHTVVCEDFLHTDKYTYLDVTENGNRFWIAVPRMDVEKGATYTYSGGLKKTNFKSTEYDRVFETLYLVSSIARVGGGTPGGGSAVDRAMAQQNPHATAPVHHDAPEGDIVKIKDLFDNRAKYEGTVVRVHGTCTKINRMIMGRNWVHLDDGSMKDADLTVTTMADVPVGTTVTMFGTINLNRDFGAGYRYEVIMEEAEVE